jgi:hypothetical protein
MASPRPVSGKQAALALFHDLGNALEALEVARMLAQSFKVHHKANKNIYIWLC